MATIKVKMLKGGRWCDHPKDPIIKTEVGQIVSFSPETAKTVVGTGHGEYYVESVEISEVLELQVEPAVRDKAKAEKKRRKK